MAVVLQLGMLAGSAQTYVYTYTGNDFTSVFNAAGELVLWFCALYNIRQDYRVHNFFRAVG